jgi:glycosyltransferase involved in cell wall biosynthesis
VRKVSIIVPVYNAGKHLNICIKSILDQTYTNIELILVNDGSTDNSLDICNNYAKFDRRVRVVDQENMGVSAARNTGMCLATGEYLQFVDCDDFIDNNMTETMVAAIEKKSASFVICGYKKTDSSTGICFQNNSSTKVGFYKIEEMLNIFDYLYTRGLINSTCNKIYHTRIIRDNSIFYQKGIELGEDLLFNLDIIKKSTSVEIIPECLYNYVKYNNNGTLTGKHRKNMYEIQKMLFSEVISLYENTTTYAHQINSLEIAYSKNILSIILHIAECYSWRNFKSYLKTAKEIKLDVVLSKTMYKLELIYSQEKLIKNLMQNKMFFAIFFYAKTKQYLREQIPGAYEILKKLGVSSNY